MKRNKDRGGKSNIENNTQQELTQELITEILLRLPVKSLVRFKSVCKSWLSLISDPYFATSHFDLTTHTQRLVFIINSTHETRSIDFEASLNDDAAIASLKLDFLLPQSYLNLKIGGSSKGFLFLYCDENIYLWNPSIGIHKQISWSPIVSSDTYVTYLYGFGYDPSTNDYLVVLGSYDDDLTYFEFFSLRANTWKEIEGVDLPYIDATYEPKVGTLFNGAIHWLAHCVDTSEIVIVSFDLTERRISEMALPDDYDETYDPKWSELWVFGGLMSLWAMVTDTVEIWVMEEHGVSSSWTKTIVLSIDEDLSFYPVCSTSNGDIVGPDGSTGLVKYNDNGQLLEHHSYCNRPSGSQVALYTESLLSFPLPRDTQQA